MRTGSGSAFLKLLGGAAVFMAANFSSDFAFAANPPADEPTPLKKVQVTIEEIVAIVEKNSGDENKAARRSKLREVINPVFDFNEMAKRSLGNHWLTISAAEQKEFVDVFSDLLARTYLSKIETVKPGMVKVDKEKVDKSSAQVDTTVTSKGDTFPIIYFLWNSAGRWKVYDVKIENIGLVANYRTEFAGIIRREKFSGLLEKLRAKQAKQ